LRDVGLRLLAAAKEASAYGLAAVHIGEVEPVVAVSADGVAHRLLFNPVVVATASETASGEEGSVSLPGVRVEIKRPVWVDVESTNAEGQRRTERFEGFLGRVVQHEIDQMEGRFFLERLSRLKRDMVLRKLGKTVAR
jgi:peptide deformylase